MQTLLLILIHAGCLLIGFNIALVLLDNFEVDEEVAEDIKKLSIVLNGIDGLSGEEEQLAIKELLK